MTQMVMILNPEVAPMPRAFASLDGLVQLSHKQGIDIRRPLLRVLTDLYVQEPNHSREEEQQFIELALRLLPAVDAQTRSSVARKLVAFGNAPQTVLAALADGAPEIEALIAAEKRRAPSTPESDAMEPELSVVAATPLPSAKPLSLGEKFFAAGPSERITMLQADAADEGQRSSFLIAGKSGASDRLESAALRRSTDELARELRQTLSISNRTAWSIVQDESGEPLLIVAKALQMPTDVLVRILLFINPSIGESVERVFSLAASYEKLPANAGAAILGSWREEVASRPKFQSIHAADQLPGAREAATVRQTPAAAENQSDLQRSQRTI